MEYHELTLLLAAPYADPSSPCDVHRSPATIIADCDFTSRAIERREPV